MKEWEKRKTIQGDIIWYNRNTNELRTDLQHQLETERDIMGHFHNGRDVLCQLRMV